MLKNKVSRAIALVSSVCCLGGAVVGLTVYAVNSNFDAQAVDTAYGNPGDQQYVIRFKEPTGVTFSLQSKQRKTFSSYIGKDQSAIAAELQSDYAILDIKKYENGVPDGETWYDIAVDEETFSSSKENSFDFYCAYNSTVQSVSLSYDNGGTSSDLYNEGGYYVLFSDSWTANQVPVVTATATYKSVTYAVTHTTEDNFIFSGNTQAVQGQNYTFSVKAKAGYEINSVKYSVSSGEAKDAEELSGGEYYIPGNEITGAINITIEVQPATYVVTFNTPANAVFTSDKDSVTPLTAQAVAHNGTLTFYLVANSGYSLANASVFYGSTQLDKSKTGTNTAGNDYVEYQLENVTAPITLTAAGIAQKTYTITTDLGGASIADLPQNVAHGASVTFTVTVPDEGKEIGTVTYTMAGMDGTRTLSSPNGVYTIPSVTGDVEITVKLKDKTYKLTLTAAEGSYFADNDKGTTHIGTTTATHGKSTTLYLFPEEHYEVKDATLVLNGATATDQQIKGSPIKDKEGVSFSIPSERINADTTVTVRGVTKKVYTVTMNDDGAPGYTIRRMTTDRLTNGDTYQFSVEAKEGFSNQGYKVSAFHTSQDDDDSVKLAPAGPADTAINTFSLTVDGDITVTVTQNDDAAIKHTVSLAESSNHVKIMVGDQALGEENNTVNHGKEFTFSVTVDAGYRVGAVHVGGNTLIARSSGVYTFTVNGDSVIEVDTVENALTITYQNASGAQDAVSTHKWDTDLKLQGTDGDGALIMRALRDAQTASGNTTFVYLKPEWWTTGSVKALFDEAQANTLAETLKTQDATLTLRLHYSVNTEKAKELLHTFYGYYRDDTDNMDKDAEKRSAYYIIRMEITGDEWKEFLDELADVGARLSAVGFTFSNTDVLVSPHNLTDYTANEIAGKYDSMTDATGTGMGVVEQTKTGTNKAWLWLFGYRWSSSGNLENQVQFIKLTKGTGTRYYRGWFMFTISGESTVIMADKYTSVSTSDTEKKPREVALAPAGIKIEMSENEESPTIE